MKYLSILLLLIVCSCAKEPLTYEEQLAKDIEIINSYLTENGLTANSTASGLRYIITQAGSGAHPGPNSTVTVNYKGYYTNKEVFDQSDPGSPITYKLSQFIKGWIEGIQLMQKGGKAILLVPSGLAYGPNPTNGIPANAVMIFEIELIDFN